MTNTDCFAYRPRDATGQPYCVALTALDCDGCNFCKTAREAADAWERTWTRAIEHTKEDGE